MPEVALKLDFLS